MAAFFGSTVDGVCFHRPTHWNHSPCYLASATAASF